MKTATHDCDDYGGADCGCAPCTIAHPSWGPDPRCWHTECRIAAVPDPRVRARLTQNARIRDWLGNWGRFDRATERGSTGRNRLARFVRALRRAGPEHDPYSLCPALAWSWVADRQ